MLKKLLLFYLFSFCGQWTFGQEASYLILDRSTREQVPFAHVLRLGESTGTMSNGDGYFIWNMSPADTLEISSIGYVTRLITAADITSSGEILLDADIINLQGLTITADDSYLYDMIDAARKQLVEDESPHVGKSYLLVHSISEDRAIEFSESFFNAEVHHGSVTDLQFKNARSYLAPRSDGRYFINIDLSRAMVMYSLLDGGSRFPTNPLELNKRKLKKSYALTVVQRSSEGVQIAFEPKRKKADYFSGYIWIDSASDQVKELVLESPEENTLFKTLGNLPIIDMAYQMVYSFQQADLLSLRIAYATSISRDESILQDTLSVEAEGILHLYGANTERFVEPTIDVPKEISDYRLFQLPPDTMIWSVIYRQNKVALTARQEQRLKEIQEDGTRFNRRSHLFESNYLHWSGDERVRIKKSPKTLPAADVRSLRDRVSKSNFMADNLKLSTILYLDYVESSGKILYETSAIFDVYQSFNHLDETSALQCYINIYFDLAEIYRRQLVARLSDSRMTPTEIEKIYQEVSTELLESQRALHEDAFAGRDIEALRSWSDFVLEKLGIDNFGIFRPDLTAEE